MNTKHKVMYAGIFLLLVIVLAGCGKTAYKAIAINEETDKCEICGMQVKDDAFAVQLTTTEGKNYKFDDIGCMNEWKIKNSEVKIGAQFVRDYDDSEWVEYEDAYYVYDTSFKTPMAYGILSFKDKAGAEAFITTQQKGELLDAAELASHDWKQNMDMMDMGEGHEHSEDGSEMDGMNEMNDMGNMQSDEQDEQ